LWLFLFLFSERKLVKKFRTELLYFDNILEPIFLKKIKANFHKLARGKKKGEHAKGAKGFFWKKKVSQVATLWNLITNIIIDYNTKFGKNIYIITMKKIVWKKYTKKSKWIKP
jgi:hypothetical protein